MNENLRKLMLAAGYSAPELAGRAQVLAELIVTECKNIAFNTSVADEAAENDWHPDQILLTIGGNIEEHFGVK